MKERIVVVGGGYAGLGVVGVLAGRPDIEMTLVDPGSGHQLIPELPEALRRQGSVDHHVVPYASLLAGSGVQHISARVVGVTRDPDEILLADGRRLPYGWLVLAPGSVPYFPPIPGLKDIARPLRDANDTRQIKDTLQYAKQQRIVVVGGGLTGVEVAGILAPDHEVVLIEGSPSLLPALGQGLAQYAHRRLVSAGVHVILGQKLTAVTDKAVVLERDQFGFDVVIWAGGIAPPEWIRHTPLPLDDKGYPVADAWGEALPRIFVAGDLWRVVIDGTPIPQTAQLAALAGTSVGHTIASRLSGATAPPFRPSLRGMLISLDPGQGVGWVLHGGIPVRGYSARTLKNISFQQYRQKLTKKFGKAWPL